MGRWEKRRLEEGQPVANKCEVGVAGVGDGWSNYTRAFGGSEIIVIEILFFSVRKVF